MNRRKNFTTEADPCVKWDLGRKTVIDNHVAKDRDYWVQDLNYELNGRKEELLLSKKERLIK